MKPLITAQQAHSRMSENSRTAQKVAIFKAKDLLDRAIQQAIDSSMTQCTVTLPEMDASLSSGLATTLRNLGYEATLKQEGGYLGTNLVRMPKTTLTVSWANAKETF